MARTLATLALLGLAASCGSGDGERTVRVFAAASLTDAFAEIEAAFEAERPDVDIVLNLAGSSALREQIIEGAPADVFAAANESTMAALVAAGEVADGAPTTFALNQLQIAVADQEVARVASLADLADPDLLVGLCAVGVPCGDLAREVLDRAGVTASVDTNEPNVRALAAKIADGELDAGLVYVTDIAAADLSLVRIPKEDNAVVSYPIVALDGAGDDARAFVDFVLSPAGREILADHGFGLP